jgi:hypothetical protein
VRYRHRALAPGTDVDSGDVHGRFHAWPREGIEPPRACAGHPHVTRPFRRCVAATPRGADQLS